VEKPQRFVRHMAGHRRSRENQILKLLGDGPHTIPDMVARMYVGLDTRLIGAAGRSVQAHLIDLQTRDLVWSDGPHWLVAA